MTPQAPDEPGPDAGAGGTGGETGGTGGGAGLAGGEPGTADVEREVVPLLEPRDGLPPLVTSPAALEEAVRALEIGRASL